MLHVTVDTAASLGAAAHARGACAAVGAAVGARRRACRDKGGRGNVRTVRVWQRVAHSLHKDLAELTRRLSSSEAQGAVAGIVARLADGLAHACLDRAKQEPPAAIVAVQAARLVQRRAALGVPHQQSGPVAEQALQERGHVAPHGMVQQCLARRGRAHARQIERACARRSVLGYEQASQRRVVQQLQRHLLVDGGRRLLLATLLLE